MWHLHKMAEVDSNVLKKEVNGISETWDVQPNNKNKNEVNIRKKVEPSAQLSEEKTNAMRGMSDSIEEAKAGNGISDLTKGAKAINGISDSTEEANAINGISDSTEESNVINGISDSTEEANAIKGISDSTEESNVIHGISDSTEEANAIYSISDSTNEANAIYSISDSTNEANGINGTSEGAISINGTSALHLKEETNTVNETSASLSEEEVTAITSSSLIKEKSPAVTESSDQLLEEETNIITKTLTAFIKEDTDTSVNETSSQILEKANVITETSAPLLEEEASATTETPIPVIEEGLNDISETSASLLKEGENMTENSAELLSEETIAITEEEANAISETWTVLWSNKKENGIALFIKLFTTYPEAQKMFKEFDGLTIEEVRSNKKLRAHALALMYALKSFLDNLDDPESLEGLVRKNAINHASRGVGPKEIMWLLPLFLELLDEIMEGNVTELQKKAWTKLYGVLASISREEVNNLSEKSAQLLPEETTAITEEEANVISETWTVLWSNKKENGIALFIKLFTTYPEAQKMFKEFDGLTIEEVRSNKKLRAHALALMYALKSFLDNLDDPETLEGLVRKNAINHANRGVGPKEIMWLLPLFLELLDEILEENATELLKKAWTKLFGVLASISQEEVNNLKEEHA
ncbi:unnamed protein product [Mytilus coruscus]|uniref:Globin domain-containing protein n=1 Tax=Mytilus coruscus TaxID=42192 RepID=A0A6J8D1P8_MYTCO|nr:unnamed protein product [Mytilus coruscus]